MVTAKEEIIEYNICKEYNAIEKILQDDDISKDYRLFQEAKMKLLRFIMICVKHDPENGDYYDDETDNLAKSAGKMLNEHEGMISMKADNI